ncbi:MAG: DNA mismatch repair endonuclease MutL [bacterium]
MPKIIQLPEEVFSKIAAGEVIEKPANAVKELVENSLDAYSKNIKIRILDSGLKLIEIRDDGVGIEESDLPLTINRYATSKIKSEKDLLNIKTFGFRGEALYAISQVSNIYITSKTDQSNKTYTLYASEGKIIYLKEEPINYFEHGTIVKVVDLFFNSPVRKNFISSSKVENYNIINVVKQLACINHNVAFSLYIDDKLVLNYLPTDSLINRVKDVFKNIYLDEFSLNIENYEVLLILSNVFKENVKKSKVGSSIYFYVNGRVVGDSNYSLVKMVKSIFDEVLDNRYYIEGVISLKLPSDEVDVNIHPRKFDVRFLKPIFVKNLIQKATKEFINTKIKTNLVFLNKEEEKINKNSPNEWYLNLKNNVNSRNNEIITNESKKKPDDLSKLYNLEKEGLFKQDNSITSFISNLVKKIEKIQGQQDKKEINKKESLLINKKEINQKDLISELNDLKELSNLKADSKLDYKLLYYWDNTYFMVYYDRAFYIVDQHNAHEKIIYTSLIKKINLHTQKILIPIEILFDDIDNNIVEFILNSKDTIEYIIKELGFDFEINNKKIILKGYPYIFNSNYSNFNFDIRSIFLDLLNLITGVSMLDKDKLLKDIVSVFACKSAIKAGNKLSENEINYLFENILKLDSLNPYFCPHGRNAIIKIDFNHINKLFERK